MASNLPPSRPARSRRASIVLDAVEVELGPPVAGLGLHHGRRGTSPTSSARATPARRGDGIEGSPGANPPRGDEVARHLDGVADGEAERPDVRASDWPARSPAGQRQVGFGQPQVVGHEDRPGPDGGGPGGGVRDGRPDVGRQGGPRFPPHLGEGPLGSVEEAGQPEIARRPTWRRRREQRGRGRPDRRGDPAPTLPPPG